MFQWQASHYGCNIIDCTGFVCATSAVGYHVDYVGKNKRPIASGGCTNQRLKVSVVIRMLILHVVLFILSFECCFALFVGCHFWETLYSAARLN